MPSPTRSASTGAPTVAFTLAGYTPRQIAEWLGQEGIFVWDGNYYAVAVTERLGVEESGGMVRGGIAHYNMLPEVERLLAAMNDFGRPENGILFCTGVAFPYVDGGDRVDYNQ